VNEQERCSARPPPPPSCGGLRGCKKAPYQARLLIVPAHYIAIQQKSWSSYVTGVMGTAPSLIGGAGPWLLLPPPATPTPAPSGGRAALASRIRVKISISCAAEKPGTGGAAAEALAGAAPDAEEGAPPGAVGAVEAALLGSKGFWKMRYFLSAGMVTFMSSENS
jgi:hypothetical protein